MKIKLCKKYPKRKKLAKRLLVGYPDAKITIKSCIGMCSHCKFAPTAKVGGKKIKKKKISKLVVNIASFM